MLTALYSLFSIYLSTLRANAVFKFISKLHSIKPYHSAQATRGLMLMRWKLVFRSRHVTSTPVSTSCLLLVLNSYTKHATCLHSHFFLFAISFFSLCPAFTRTHAWCLAVSRAFLFSLSRPEARTCRMWHTFQKYVLLAFMPWSSRVHLSALFLFLCMPGLECLP